jgi:recombination protein RecA
VRQFLKDNPKIADEVDHELRSRLLVSGGGAKASSEEALEEV